MSFRRLIGWLLMTSFIGACTNSSRIVLPVSFEAAPHHLELHKELRTMFPDKGRFSARVKVTFGGKEMDFITYTLINGADIRSKAMGEFGGTLFDFLIINGERILLSFPEPIPERIVRTGPVRDLYHLFTISRIATSIDACGEDCVEISDIDDVRHIFKFSTEGKLHRSVAYLNQKLICEVNYTDWKQFDTWDTTIPGTLILDHYNPDYGMKINILDLATGIPNMNAFHPPEKYK